MKKPMGMHLCIYSFIYFTFLAFSLALILIKWQWIQEWKMSCVCVCLSACFMCICVWVKLAPTQKRKKKHEKHHREAEEVFGVMQPSLIKTCMVNPLHHNSHTENTRSRRHSGSAARPNNVNIMSCSVWRQQPSVRFCTLRTSLWARPLALSMVR